MSAPKTASPALRRVLPLRSALRAQVFDLVEMEHFAPAASNLATKLSSAHARWRSWLRSSRQHSSMGQWTAKTFGNSCEMGGKAYDCRLIVEWLSHEVPLAASAAEVHPWGEFRPALAWACAAWCRELENCPAFLTVAQAAKIRELQTAWMSLYSRISDLCAQQDPPVQRYHITPKFHYLEHCHLDMLQDAATCHFPLRSRPPTFPPASSPMACPSGFHGEGASGRGEGPGTGEAGGGGGWGWESGA
jgi:hypothetical protein